MAYVYAHKMKDSNDIFYVGIGVNDCNNFKRASATGDRNKHWKHVVAKHGYTIHILFCQIPKETAMHHETLLIKRFGRRDLGTGQLVNMTDGGEGALNSTPWNKGKKVNVGGFKGKRTQEYKDHLSKILKEKGIRPKPYIRTDHHRKHLSKIVSDKGLFKTRNPNRSDNWITFFQTENIEASCSGFRDFCNDVGVHYVNLRSWSKKFKGLHPKYKMRINATIKKS